METANTVIKAVFQGLRLMVLNSYETLRDCHWKFEEIVMRSWDCLENYFDELWTNGLESCFVVLDVVTNILQIVSDGVEGRIEELEKKLMAVGVVQKIMKVYKEYSNWIEELSLLDIIEKIESIFNIK